MIDELEYLREARPETLAPDPVLVLRARRTLLRHALRTRNRRRYVVRALVGVAAVTAILGVVGIVNVGDNKGASSAAAAVLNQSAATFESLPAPRGGQYLYVRSVETVWNYERSPSATAAPDQGGEIATVTESWIPGDRNQVGVERLTGSDGKTFTTPVGLGDVPSIYDEHPDDPTALLEELRTLANEQMNRSDDHNEAVWRTAFGIVLDPQASDALKADVLRALAGLEGVTVVDRDAEIGDRTGTALGFDKKYTPQLVFEPSSGVVLGVIGHPERGKNWVGPGEPRYTVELTSKIVNTAPMP